MAEKTVELDSVEQAAAVFGSGDQNIHLLEKAFHVVALYRSNALKFTGEDADVEAAAALTAAAVEHFSKAWEAK